MLVIYSISISVLFLLFLPFSLIHVFNKTDFVGEYFAQRLGIYPKKFYSYVKNIRKEKNNIIWVHAASLGELKIANCVLKELSEKGLDFGYIVSTNSNAGKQMADKLFGPERNILMAMDLPWVIKWLVKRVKPTLTIIVEFEVWPNFVRYLSKEKSKLVLINGSLDNKILKYYDYFPGLLRDTLNKIDYLGIKSEAEKVKVSCIGVYSHKIKLTGNMKREKIEIVDEKTKIDLRYNLKIPHDVPIWVIGSTHSGEEEMVFNIYKDLKREIRDLVLILAPRHIDRTKRVKELGKRYGLELIECTELKTISKQFLSDDEIILLDTNGELAQLYSIATVAFVGGSLVNKGGHNLLEPVFYGKPVLFGPYIQDFQEIAEVLLTNKIGVMVRNEDELRDNLLLLLKDLDLRREIEQRATKLLQKEEGALSNNIDIIEELLQAK